METRRNECSAFGAASRRTAMRSAPSGSPSSSGAVKVAGRQNDDPVGLPRSLLWYESTRDNGHRPLLASRLVSRGHLCLSRRERGRPGLFLQLGEGRLATFVVLGLDERIICVRRTLEPDGDEGTRGLRLCHAVVRHEGLERIFFLRIQLHVKTFLARHSSTNLQRTELVRRSRA